MTDDNRRDDASAGALPGSERAAKDPWSTYWEHGFLTSCADAFDANYQGRIRRVWETFFERLSAGSRILDICTGNGAIAVIASEASKRLSLNFEVHGIDQAVIRPAETLKLGAGIVSEIRFHSQTAAESTGFPDGHFDAVTGQYALEYTNVVETVRELHRIMNSNSRALFVIHHAGSVVLTTTQAELAHGELLFTESRLFDHAEALIKRMGSAPRPEDRIALAKDSGAEELRSALNSAAADVTRRIRDSEHPEMLRTALGYVSDAFKRLDTEGLDSSLNRLRTGRSELVANVGRLNDLAGAAMDAKGAEELSSLMRSTGFDVERLDPLEHDEKLVGWTLELAKTQPRTR